MSEQETSRDLMQIFTQFAIENDVPFNKLSDNQIVLAVESNYNTLSAVFQLQNDQDGYEHYTHQFTIPPDKRGKVAEYAIAEAFREISSVLPPDDNRLFTYGSRRGLKNREEYEVRDGILDDMGRIAGFQNDKHTGIIQILSD